MPPKALARDSRKDYYGQNHTFLNVWRRACVARKENELREEDIKAKAHGRITQVSSKDKILSDALDLVQPMPGRRDRFEAHIRSCSLINPRAKDRLSNESTSIYQKLAPERVQAPANDAGTTLQGLQASGSGEFSPEQQKDFESDSCKLWVANGFAWHAINHPQTRIFFETWMPASGAKLPDRHKLSGPILQQEVDKANGLMRQTISGRIATGMSDGWKNIKRESLLATMARRPFYGRRPLVLWHTEPIKT